jgi:hypothetical protein
MVYKIGYKVFVGTHYEYFKVDEYQLAVMIAQKYESEVETLEQKQVA